MTQKLILKELSRYKIGTYADILYRNALLYPDTVAFIYGPQRISFSQYNRRVNSLIHALQSMGLKKGDGIGIFSWNCLEYTDVFGAGMKGGFIVSPFNPRMQADELDYIINYSGAETLFVGTGMAEIIDPLKPRLPGVKRFISLEDSAPGMTAHHELLENFSQEEPEVQVEEDDPFVIFYTSGTTGLPRGALYTHFRKLEEARTKVLQVGLGPGDKHVMVLPLFHIGGFTHFWAFFCVGASNVIMTQRSFDPAATLQIIQDEKATDIQIVPTQLVTLLAHPNIEGYDLSSLKQIWYAASPMPTELLRKGMARFGSIFAQGYGQSESGPDISILTRESHLVLDGPDEAQKILGSCGQPCLWVHARIVDENDIDVKPHVVGEIVVQSKSIMVGYWHKPDETREVMRGGWLHTGDMAYYDEQGFMYIVDRKKDMIISGGENVFPREVEEVLYRHPSVLQVAVIGVPDEVWVERVHAEIVLKEGHKATSEEIIDFCKQHLARYKAPKSVKFVESLPKNPQGKILKREIRGKYWQGKAREI